MRKFLAICGIVIGASVIPTGATIGITAAANAANTRWASCAMGTLVEHDGGVATNAGGTAYICDNGAWAPFHGKVG